MQALYNGYGKHYSLMASGHGVYGIGLGSGSAHLYINLGHTKAEKIVRDIVTNRSIVALSSLLQFSTLALVSRLSFAFR